MYDNHQDNCARFEPTCALYKGESCAGRVELPHVEILVLLQADSHQVRLEPFRGHHLHDVRQLDRLDPGGRGHLPDHGVDLVSRVLAPGGNKQRRIY